MNSGAMDEEQIRAAFTAMESQFKAIQEALKIEQSKTEYLQQLVGNKKEEEQSIITAIRKGQMKEIAPKKYANMLTSGSFKAWASSMKDYVFRHDAKSKELIEHLEQRWQMDERLGHGEMIKCCLDKGDSEETDAALHMVIGTFLEGESKILADSAEFTNPETLETHKSGLALWRLLHYNSDRSSSFNVIAIVEHIRSMQQAKTIQDVLPKMAALDKAHQ